MIKQEEIFNTESTIYVCVSNYEAFPAKVLTFKDEKLLVKGMHVLRKVGRKVATFLNDHRIFKRFIFNGVDHHTTLLSHAQNVLTILVERKKPEFELGEFADLEKFLMIPDYDENSKEGESPMP